MSKDYAESRAAILRNLDGVHYEVDPKKKVGFLWLDRPPLNVVSYRGRAQIAAIIEAFAQDPDLHVVVIRGKNGVFTSGGDVKAFPQIERDGMSHLAWNIAAPDRILDDIVTTLTTMSPLALKTVKRVLNTSYDTSLSAGFEVEGHAYEKLRESGDYKEGIAAFTEKRKPNFTGA